MSGIKVRLHPHSNYLRDSEYTLEDEALLYDQMLEDVLRNVRWYLDQSSYLPEFRVSWNDYQTKHKATLPYKHTFFGRNPLKKDTKTKPL